MSSKKNILVLCGGQSVEHEISLLSARNIVASLDKHYYEAIILAISCGGLMGTLSPEELNTISRIEDSFLAHRQGRIHSCHQGCVLVNTLQSPNGHPRVETHPIHVVFPILHGLMGEDGTVQGWLELLNVPYVGSPVLASSVCMDKRLSKSLLLYHGIPTVPFHSLTAGEPLPSYEEMSQRLGSPHMFLKPSALGSSVGIEKVSDPHAYREAIHTAFSYGETIIIEKAVQARELECAVLGNDNPAASGIAEIIPSHEFYSYSAKYLDPQGALIALPADVEDGIAESIRRYSITAFKLLGCQGMARVDFFLTKQGELFISELNTIPGFTSISCYPKLWEAAGIPCTELTHRLIQLGEERFARIKNHCTRHDISRDKKYYPRHTAPQQQYCEWL